ncbi:hypothetical protein J2858_002934 [Neorhizobium galegae]|uniref:hypothetical protein n=1 Tax=Neorhizobium galegae TaxID=399 RepID=UPI001AE5CE1F|nr:hypothetical protein [Neorhizobium galegae]MBP2550001.1 hypothetical protein [Neorhizobium galegae]
MRIIRLVFILAIGFAGVIGSRWYSYVTNTDSPYNESGIEINSRMPGPLRKWGCDRLHVTFGNMLPPYGCQAGADGRDWL